MMAIGHDANAAAAMMSFHSVVNSPRKFSVTGATRSTTLTDCPAHKVVSLVPAMDLVREGCAFDRAALPGGPTCLFASNGSGR